MREVMESTPYSWVLHKKHKKTDCLSNPNLSTKKQKNRKPEDRQTDSKFGFPGLSISLRNVQETLIGVVTKRSEAFFCN
jgi:hypothetical protein